MKTCVKVTTLCVDVCESNDDVYRKVNDAV